MMGHRHRRRFAVAALVVLAGFIASSCTALGVWPATSSFGASGKMTFALSDGATGGGPISVNLQRGGGGSNGITYVGTMSTGSGFNGPQGQFQVKLIGGAACFATFGCDPTPGFPWSGWTGSLARFELTSPSGVEYSGDALQYGFNDPSVCPAHIVEAARGSKVELDGVVTGDPSITAHLEVWICAQLDFTP